MRKSVGKVIGLLVVTILSFSMLFIWSGNNVSAQEEWHVYPGQSIQDTADNASDGDTIYVHAGTYVENIKVNKRLDLIGDGIDEVTVKAKKVDDHTFHLTADGITMTGFTITDSYTCGYGGISIDEADNCRIYNCNCSRNLCAGIFLMYSNYCEITDCIVSDNDCGGIKFKENSDHNVLKNNVIERNRNVGLELSRGSSDNLIYNNYFNNTGEYGLWRNVIDRIPWGNKWNITKESGPNILGGPFLGGNYFADYTGEDNDGDGFGDTPYEIKTFPANDITNMDYLPLVPWTPQPILSYNPSSHDFGDMEEGQTDNTTFEIWNSGTGTLEYALSETCSWVGVSSTSGNSTGEHDTIIVDINTTGLLSGHHSCDISISSNDGSGTFHVEVDVIELGMPTVKITKPQEKSLYIRNKRIMPFFGTLILGAIDIEADATDDTRITKVEFYIDNNLKANANEEPYSWTWDKKAFFKHTIKVIAYDEDGNTATDSVNVRIFNT